MTQQAPTPARILEIWGNVFPVSAMLAGVQLDLFTSLDHGPLSTDGVANALGVKPQKIQPLLDNLVCAGLLTVADRQYANSDEAGYFLVRGRPSYMGPNFELWSEFRHAIGQTAATIRTGIPQAEHDYSHMSESELLAWMRPLNDTAIGSGQALAERYDFTAYHSILDVGGGLGGLSVTLARAYPSLRATIIDLPTITPLAERYLAEECMRDRVESLSIDLIHDAPTGPYDAAVLMRFVQCFSAEDARAALRNVGAALRSGGVLMILGVILDDSRLAPANAVQVNLVFLNVYAGGQSHTETEHRQWLTEAGFTDIRRDTPINNLGVIVARKS